MPDVILTLEQIENIFQSLTCSLTGLDRNKGVRIAWPTGGSPAWKIHENVVFLKISPASDNYTQQRETEYQDDTQNDVKKVIAAYTRVHLVQWIIYGPDSYDNAETIRNGIYLPATKSTLAVNNLHLILDVPPVVRLPELFNGQWWQRCDFQVRFNEKVIRYSTVPYLTGANITIKTDTGKEEVIN